MPVQVGSRNLHSKQGVAFRHPEKAVFIPANSVHIIPQNDQPLVMDEFETGQFCFEILAERAVHNRFYRQKSMLALTT
jgi:hypothetical protein